MLKRGNILYCQNIAKNFDPINFLSDYTGYFFTSKNQLEKCPKNCKKCINSLKCTECNINYKT